jgi:histone H3/H4
MSKVSKKRQTLFPDATIKRLVNLSVNGPTFAQKEELKKVWIKEFDQVEGVDALKRISEIAFDAGEMKNLKRSAKGCTDKLKKLNDNPTDADLLKICKDLTITVDETSTLDEQIKHVVDYLESKRRTAEAEINGMKPKQDAFLAAEKAYDVLRLETFKSWRMSFSGYQKYLNSKLALELRRLSEESKGVKLSAPERQALTAKRNELKKISSDNLVSAASILEYFTTVKQESSFTTENANRFVVLFTSRHSIKEISSSGYRVSNAGTVCARVAELVSSALISSTVRYWASTLAGGSEKTLTNEFLAKADIPANVRPFLNSSATYQNIIQGKGVTLSAQYKLALPHVKKVRKTLGNGVSFPKGLLEIIASIVCEVITSLGQSAVRVVETGNGKTISAEHLKCVLGLLFGASEDLAVYTAIVDAAYH